MWKLSITTTPEGEEAVTELLAEVFGQPASSYTDFETRTTTVAVYCKARPADLPAKRAALWCGLALIERCGLNVGRARVRAQKLARENWAESWKRHFKPIEVGGALLIKPSWSNRRPRRRQAVVVLDPGLSFGTGQHPTTAFCLRELTWWRRPGQPQAFLDLGTGSGILAIAAAKLGYLPIHAIDFDPECIRVASANARLNRVSRQVRVACRDLTRLPLKSAQLYDLICANLLSTLLVAERERIVRRLKPGGVLVLAGILKSEFELVAENYGHSGFWLIASKTAREWRSGNFARRVGFFWKRGRF